MRALAEESGELRAVGARALPARVFAGGIQAVVQRRLDRVPKSAQPLLQLAAIGGQELDLRVLQKLEPQLEPWLRSCSSAAVLVLAEERWRFAHHKLRMGIIDGLTEEAHVRLHGEFAAALERAYADDELPAATLAYHYGESRSWEQAARFAVRAGELALRNGASVEAAVQLSRGLAWQEKIGAKLTERLHAHRLLLQALVSQGRDAEAGKIIEQIWRLAGDPLPRGKLRGRLNLLLQAGRQAVHLTGRVRPLPDDKEVLRELIEGIYDASAVLARQGNHDELLYLSLHMLNAAEQAGLSEQLQRLYVSFSYMLHMVPLLDMSALYRRKAELYRSTAVSPAAAAWISFGYCMLDCSDGRWDQARRHGQRGIEIARSIGDHFRVRTIHAELLLVSLWTGDYRGVQAIAAELCAHADSLQNRPLWAWASSADALARLRAGQLHDADSLLRQALEQPGLSDDLPAYLFTNAVAAVAALRLGDRARARNIVDSTATRRGSAPLLARSMIEALACHAEVYLDLLATTGAPHERRSLETAAEQVMNLLRRPARIYPLGQPRLLILRGRLAILRGDFSAGRKLCQRGLDGAQRLQLPFEEAQAHRALAESQPQGSLWRRLHEERAAQLERMLTQRTGLSAPADQPEPSS